MDHNCPSCGSTEIFERIELDVIDYGGSPESGPEAQIPVNVPVGKCTNCEFNWTDFRAEEIREKAIQEYLSKKVV